MSGEEDSYRTQVDGVVPDHLAAEPPLVDGTLADGRAYHLMDLMEGESLRKRLARCGACGGRAGRGLLGHDVAQQARGIGVDAAQADVATRVVDPCGGARDRRASCSRSSSPVRSER